MSHSQVVLLILIDGLRHDYINQEDSPFLYNLAQQNVYGKMRETFAFQLRPAFFAGLYPEECEVAHLYYYDPQNSPFAEISKHGYSREQLDQVARRIEAKRGHSASALYGNSAQIPLNLLPFFGFSEKYNIQEPGALGEKTTLFDQLRNAGKKWLWIAYPTDVQTAAEIRRVFHLKIDQEEYSFIYLHFSEVDWAGHEHGPGSVQQREALRGIDEAIRDVFVTLNRRYAQVKSLIFGDHGMVPVKKVVDLETHLKALSFVIEQDYIYFLDSTQARFWFKNGSVRRAITAMLAGLETGKILSQEDFARLHFRFKHNKFGELIYVVEDEQIIFPNFFQRDTAPLGMHGYLPEVVNNWAAFILAGIEKDFVLTEPIEMVEIYPALLEMLGLPTHLPSPGQLAMAAKIVEPTIDLSIVIPTYNRANNLKSCLFHLQRQTYDHNRFEIIVVDDGSADYTGQVVNDFVVMSDIVTHYCRQVSHKGPAAARNCGLRQAKGRLTLFMGDDTYADPDLIKAHVAAHQRWPAQGLGILGHTYIVAERAKSPFEVWNHQSGMQFRYDGLTSDELDLNYGYFYTSNISVKTAMLRTHGIFDESFTCAMWEDIELGYRLECQGLLLKYENQAKVYHDHPTDIGRFTKRQYQVGQVAVKFWHRYPELLSYVLPNWHNPLLLFDEERIASLVQWAIETDAALASDSQANLPQKIEELLNLSQLLLERAYALGFAHGLRAAPPDQIELDGLPADVAFLIQTHQRLTAGKKLMEEAYLHYAPLKADYENLLFQSGRLFMRLGRWLQDFSDHILLALPRPIKNLYFRLRGFKIPG